MRTDKSKIISAISLIAILLIIITISMRITASVPFDTEGGCTLKQAYEIALSGAKVWAEDAQLYKIISMDNHDSENSEHGIDGLRNAWSLFFESADKNQQYNIYVVKSKVYAEETVLAPAYRTLEQDDMANIMDSGDAYDYYAECLQLKGGTEWAFGYHYILDYVCLDGTDNEPVLAMTMRGLSEDGREMSVIMDPFDGHLLKLIAKAGYDEDGNSIWENVDFDESLGMTREEVIENYNLYHSARENLMDPKELAEAFMKGIRSNRFSPYSEVEQYTQEEWERLMTEKYDDAWKEW